MAGKGFHAYLVSITAGLNLYGVYARREEVRKEINEIYPNIIVIYTNNIFFLLLI